MAFQLFLVSTTIIYQIVIKLTSSSSKLSGNQYENNKLSKGLVIIEGVVGVNDVEAGLRNFKGCWRRGYANLWLVEGGVKKNMSLP